MEELTTPWDKKKKPKRISFNTIGKDYQVISLVCGMSVLSDDDDDVVVVFMGKTPPSKTKNDVGSAGSMLDLTW